MLNGATSNLDEYGLRRAADILRASTRAVALTGAGISTPSGIPDFRSPASGLWENVDVMKIASISGFRRNPEAFFEWIRPLTRLMVDAHPNPAHDALAKLEQLGLLKTLITQNIDMLHARAGSRNLLEVHGHMRSATCIECSQSHPTAGLLEAFVEQGAIPRCPGCGGVLKPDIILMGEQLPRKVFDEAQQAAGHCDVMLIAGSSLTVAPVSELPLLAHNSGAKLIMVNYQETHLDRYATVAVHNDVADALPHLVNLVIG